MSAGRRGEQADGLIVTAVKDEWDAVVGRHRRRTAESLGEAHRSDGAGGRLSRLHERARDPAGRGRSGLRDGGASRPSWRRYRSASGARDPLPRDVGVCAGRRGDLALGDVFIADRTWPYDQGKVKVSVDDQGQRIEGFQGDVDLYRIHPPEWKRCRRFER